MESQLNAGPSTRLLTFLPMGCQEFVLSFLLDSKKDREEIKNYIGVGIGKGLQQNLSIGSVRTGIPGKGKRQLLEGNKLDEWHVLKLPLRFSGYYNSH